MKNMMKKVAKKTNNVMGFSEKSRNGRYPGSNAKDVSLDGLQQINNAKLGYRAAKAERAAQESNPEEINQKDVKKAYMLAILSAGMWLGISTFFTLKTNLLSNFEHSIFGSIVVVSTFLYGLMYLYQAYRIGAIAKKGGA
jgi:hypothetical protein